MISSTVRIEHPQGLHARPASVFVREAGKFRSEISVSANGVTVNGKSIMGLLMLALGQGTEVTVGAAGPDAEAAVERLAAVLNGPLE